MHLLQLRYRQTTVIPHLLLLLQVLHLTNLSMSRTIPESPHRMGPGGQSQNYSREQRYNDRANTGAIAPFNVLGRTPPTTTPTIVNRTPVQNTKNGPSPTAPNSLVSDPLESDATSESSTSSSSHESTSSFGPPSMEASSIPASSSPPSGVQDLATHHTVVGTIAGGTIGGAVGLLLFGGLIFWWTMRRRRLRMAPSTAYIAVYGTKPPSILQNRSASSQSTHHLQASVGNSIFEPMSTKI
ncbi:hypothetical protein D9756_001432 [Leucocoprinus leucothites]|uniref:Mid2 domain-containing protein n=1 Tax=Leucocoprinus leucothites TaxID=201217 RepID=A0A8H5LHQ1_9AGAR|nr:hypothetical protein D9756_001432 [Leucoagaricus leucothites]